MQAYHPGTGMTLEFPDNTPDEAIQQHFQNAQMNMPSTAPSVAQQFLDGARSAMDQQQAAPAPLNGRGFVGLDPQQAQFMLQQRQNQAAMQQQSASDAARNRLQQQQLIQQGLEGEKDRSQQLKLHKESLKNLLEERKIQAQRDKLEAEARVAEGKAGRDLTEKLANIDKTLAEKRLTQDETQFNKGNSLDERRVAIAEGGLELDKQQMEQQGWEKGIMAYQGKNVLAYFKAGQPPRIMGDAPLDDSVAPITKQSRVYQDSIIDATKSIVKEEGIPFTEAGILARGAIAQNFGLKAFETEPERKRFVNVRAQQLAEQAKSMMGESGNNPEAVAAVEDRAMVDAEIESYEANGLYAWQDPETGDVVYDDPNKKESDDSE